MSPCTRVLSAVLASLAPVLLLGGCPTGGGQEFIRGGGQNQNVVGGAASITVFTPSSSLSVAGGTQIEVNWRATTPSRFSSFTVFVDPDRDPNNGNEIIATSALALTESQFLVDTTRLARGTYSFGVRIEELSAVLLSGYAPGQVTIDERPLLVFTSPRENFVFDRSARINPTIEVSWTVSDPDSTNSVEVFLDPDNTPSGNEVLLFRSTSSTGDSFTFDLPTFQFAAGEYRLLASISDGRNVTSVYSPTTIRLLSRLAGPVDLRNITDPNSPVRGAVFEGFNPRDNAGSLVAPVPDIDGDGFDEVMIVAQFGKPRFAANLQRTGVGECYLVYGRAQRFSGNINLNSIGALVRGEVYPGVGEISDPVRPSRGVTSFAVLSDWDNDGTRDFVFGVPFTDSTPVSPYDIAGFFRTGAAVAASSQSIAGFGGGRVLNIADFGVFVRADGDPDQGWDCPHGFVGPKASALLGEGTSEYYAQRTYGITSPAWLGARFTTNDFGDQCGETVSAYRCEGFGDSCGLIMSMPNRNPAVNVTTRPDLPGAGVASVYFRPGGFDPWNLGDGSIPQEGPFMYIVDDLRPTQALYPSSPGFVIGASPRPPCFFVGNPLTYPEPRNTARFYGGFAGAGVGGATSVGDVNADGIDDIMIGSSSSADGRGSSYIVFGRLEGLVLQEVVGAELNLEELALPVDSGIPRESRIFDGLRVVGDFGDRLGQSQAAAGDFNNDGINDVLIGSPFVSGRRGGAAVFFGSRTILNLTEREFPYQELPQRGLGVLFVGEIEGDLAGARVATAGDVDGDGFDDILIAAPERSILLDSDFDGVVDIDRTQCGVVYLVYGGPDLVRRRTPGGEPGVLELKYLGTEHLPGATFIGRNSGDQLGAGIGEQGDRSTGIAVAGDVDGDGESDFLLTSVRASPRNRPQAGETYLIYGVGE